MLPRILHPDQLQGYRFSGEDHCRLALLSEAGDGGGTLFLEVHDPNDRVPPHAHHHAAELFFVLRGEAIFHVDDRAIHARGGDFVAVPGDALHDLENPGPDRLYLLTLLSRDDGFADLLRHGIPTPLDADDLSVLRSL